jgi:NADPH:quinone reductase-like Zn-dependent oxidoreductase
MRAYQLPQGTGIDALVKADLPAPKPGPRQVLIKVAACSLNFRDLATLWARIGCPRSRTSCRSRMALGR